MRVVVTGGAGFIGSHLSERLLSRGHQVVCVDNFNDYYDSRLKRQNLKAALTSTSFRLVEGDVLDNAVLDRLLLDQDDMVVHLAARTGVRRSIDEPGLYEQVNVQGTINLLDACRRRKVNHFIFASSSSVYGPTAAIPFSEHDNALEPLSPYGASKLAAEHFCRISHHLYGLPITCLRFFSVYGPRQRPDMAIHTFVRLIEEGSPITLYGGDTTRRDYTYVDDVVEGIIRSIERPNGFQIYNLGTRESVLLRDLIEIIERAMNKRAVISLESSQPGEMPATCASIARAGRDLGYAPTVEIEEGVRRFVRWFRQAFFCP